MVQNVVAGGWSVPRAGALVGILRSTSLYQAKPTDDADLVDQMRQRIAPHRRYGYRRMSMLVRRTRPVNERRVRR